MAANPTVLIHTLGCKLNQAESEQLGRQLARTGFGESTGRPAACILNTCSVTHAADRKSRQLVRLLRRQHPAALIVVTGCYASRAAGELERCGADLVLGNADKSRIPEIVAARLGGAHGTARPAAARVRSFIKVQEGCRNFCSYCIVPFVRPDVSSRDPESLIQEIRERVDSGYAEVVLTGTEIGAYNGGGLDLAGLIPIILRETGVQRLHLSSLQPQWIMPGLLDLWTDKRLVRHFHLALQSGSDSVLSRMRRRYDTNVFRKTVAQILGIMPDAAVTTDIIVGFPGESEREFTESYDFCRRTGFAAMHVFAFSARPGTAAADMPGKVSEPAKKERSLRMIELAACKADEFAKRFIGQSRPVLWENEMARGSGIYTGLTDNYIRIYTRAAVSPVGSVVPARALDCSTKLAGISLKKSTRGNHGELWGEVQS